MSRARNIYFDLDGTLAYHIKDNEPFDAARIGAPIPGGIELARHHVEAGDNCYIFTARASTRDHHTIFDGTAEEYFEYVKTAVQAWCKEHIGHVFPVTCEKDYKTDIIYDDIARQVLAGEGKLLHKEHENQIEDLKQVVCTLLDEIARLNQKVNELTNG